MTPHDASHANPTADTSDQGTPPLRIGSWGVSLSFVEMGGQKRWSLANEFIHFGMLNNKPIATIIMLRKALALAVTASFAPLCQLDQIEAPDTKRHAICILYPNNSNARGVASFSQENINSPTKIACSVKGLTPNCKHGIHVHEFGDLTEGCVTAGGHYNPHNKKHGGPFTEERHVGDLGNLMADPFGNSYMCFIDKEISLYGEYSIVGRSVVVHAQEDDLGRTDHPDSTKTGNSGARVACGVIGLAKSFKTVPPVEE